jgi:acetyl-CoA C-acetyltransferase
MSEPVYVIGTGRTDFKRNLQKEGLRLRDVIVEAGRAAIAEAGIAPGDIGAGIVGNFAGGLYTRQLHLGSLLMEIDSQLRGIPTLHTEAACASGSVGVVVAAQQIMAGIHQAVLVVGAEQQKTMSPAQGAEVLAGAGDYYGEKSRYGEHFFPKLFGSIATTYRQQHGLTARQLALVVAKSRAHARLNPLAQMRDSMLTVEDAMAVSETNPCIADPLKLCDCSQITDGAAAILLCSETFAKKLGRARVRLQGYGQTTDHLGLDQKDVPLFPYARKAVDQAYAMAGCGPGEIDGAEVHDCFSITEILTYEILRLAETGQGAKFAETGATMLPAVRRELGLAAPTEGRVVPVNSGGGLMSEGHPVGATGVRQVVSAYRHLTGSSGAYQVENARRFLTFNLGGSFTTNVAMIWGRA